MSIAKMFLLTCALALCTLLPGCQKEEEPAAVRPAEPGYQGTIVAVGDSLTAGLGLRESDAYPAQLQEKLNQTGYRWRVINAGISGETSSGALARLDWILKLNPDVVILETGANDGLRGIEPQLIQRNLDKIVTTLKAKDVVVVLAGMQMLKNLGGGYVSQFAAIYPKIAQEHDLILIPFLLSKVAGDPRLNLEDGIHPTAQGYRIVTETVYPYALKAIQLKTMRKPR